MRAQAEQTPNPNRRVTLGTRGEPVRPPSCTGGLAPHGLGEDQPPFLLLPQGHPMASLFGYGRRSDVDRSRNPEIHKAEISDACLGLETD